MVTPKNLLTYLYSPSEAFTKTKTLTASIKRERKNLPSLCAESLTLPGIFMVLCSILVIGCYLVAAPHFAAAAERVPLKIAVLPFAIHSHWVDDSTIDSLESRLEREFHVPLNGTLHAVEYIGESESTAALDKVMATLRQTKRKVKLKEAMQPLAEELGADIVICPSVSQFYEYTSMAWEGLVLHSCASLELIGYERFTGQPFAKRATRRYNDTLSTWGQASYLAKDCLESMLAELSLKQKISKYIY